MATQFELKEIDTIVNNESNRFIDTKTGKTYKLLKTQ